MVGLMIKDIRMMMRQKQVLLLFLLISVMLGFSRSDGFVLGYMPALFVIYIGNLVYYDEAENGYSFLMTLPITRKSYVMEKFVLTAIMTFVSWLVACIVWIAAKLIHGEEIFVTKEIWTAVYTLPVILACAMVMMAANIRFGLEKIRILLVGLVAVVMLLAVAIEKIGLMDKINEISMKFHHMTSWEILWIELLIALGMIVLSYLYGQHAMEKKSL